METLDAKVLLLNIKENISLIENGTANDSIFNDIEKDFINLLDLLKLFLISKRDVYYGYFMMNMKYKINFNAKIIAGIRLNSYPPVFESNPLILCKFSLKEIVYIICHEIEHIIFNHPAEMVKCNPSKDSGIFKKFNYAADASVNDRINYEIKSLSYKFMSMPSGCITSKYFEESLKINDVLPLENYKYYFDLIKDQTLNEENQPKIMSNGLNGNCDNSEDLEADEKTGPKTMLSSGSFEDHNWEVSEDEYEELKEITKEFINESFKMIKADVRGLLPATFIDQVEKINSNPILSWQSILKKYIGTISAGYRKTRTRLNRREPDRFDISGKINDKTLKIVVAIDTSGSVTNEDISYIFTEIFSIISKKHYELTIIECDSEVQKVYKVNKLSDIQLKVTGRGGTAFSPVIDYINNDKYYRDALLIYFTDGYGEKKIKKPLTYKNLWVILGNEKDLSLKEPYGIVVAMHTYEGDY